MNNKSLPPVAPKDWYAEFLRVPLWLAYALTFILFLFAFVVDSLLGWVGVALCLIQLHHCVAIYPTLNGNYDPLIMGLGRALGFAAAASGYFNSEYLYYSGAGYMIIGFSYLWWLRLHQDMAEFRKVFVRFLSCTLILIGVMYWINWQL